MNSYKVVLVGGPNIGKTNMVRRCAGQDPIDGYEPTLGVDVTPLRYNTNHGTYIVNVWDIGGQYQGDHRTDYYHGTNGAIIADDGQWLDEIKKVSPRVTHLHCDTMTDIDPFFELLKSMTNHEDLVLVG